MEEQVRRVVITGLGMINSLGHDKEESFEAIVNGECGVDTITLFNPEKFSVKIAAEVKNFNPSKVMDPKEVKKADRFIQLWIYGQAQGGHWNNLGFVDSFELTIGLGNSRLVPSGN